MGKARIAIVGGDDRELTLARELARKGYDIRLCGFDTRAPDGTEHFSCPREAARGVQAVILPMAGVKGDFSAHCPGNARPPVINADFFAVLPEKTPVFIGWATKELKELAAKVRLIEIAQDDELAVLNSIPTAEGAIALAINETPITIHGNKAMVVGFGRCGITLGRMLGAMGAQVTVAARKASQRARAGEMGFSTCGISDLCQHVETMAFIFNTIPAPVLTEEVLANAGKCRLLVDIASGGGTDFAAARSLDIKALLAPGLPGKVAPETAGKILAKVIPRLLCEYGIGGD